MKNTKLKKYSMFIQHHELIEESEDYEIDSKEYINKFERLAKRNYLEKTDIYALDFTLVGTERDFNNFFREMDYACTVAECLAMETMMSAE